MVRQLSSTNTSTSMDVSTMYPPKAASPACKGYCAWGSKRTSKGTETQPRWCTGVFCGVPGVPTIRFDHNGKVMYYVHLCAHSQNVTNTQAIVRSETMSRCSFLLKGVTRNCVGVTRGEAAQKVGFATLQLTVGLMNQFWISMAEPPVSTTIDTPRLDVWALKACHLLMSKWSTFSLIGSPSWIGWCLPNPVVGCPQHLPGFKMY